MNFPQNLKYTNEHEWIRVEGDIAYVGICLLYTSPSPRDRG